MASSWQNEFFETEMVVVVFCICMNWMTDSVRTCVFFNASLLSSSYCFSSSRPSYSRYISTNYGHGFSRALVCSFRLWDITERHGSVACKTISVHSCHKMFCWFVDELWWEEVGTRNVVFLWKKFKSHFFHLFCNWFLALGFVFSNWRHYFLRWRLTQETLPVSRRLDYYNCCPDRHRTMCMIRLLLLATFDPQINHKEMIRALSWSGRVV